MFGCRDIFFSIINENINALEPLVFGFQKESETLMGLARRMLVSERSDLTTRSYIAKEYSILLRDEVRCKL